MNHATILGLRELILSTAILSLCTAAHAGLSYQQFTFGSDGNDYLSDGAVAPDRSIYLTGTTTGAFAAPNAGGTDNVLMQMSPTGSVLWSRQFGTADDDGRPRMTLASDALYVQSTRQDFGALSGPATLSRFDLSGNLSWSRPLTSALAARPIVDTAGNVYVSGINQQTEQSPLNVWMQKYDSSGNLLWNRAFASPVNGQPTHTIFSRDGGVFVLGRMYPPAQGTSGIYIRKYDASGAEVWTSELDSAGYLSPLGLTEDAQGNLRIGGNSNSSVISPGGGWVFVSSRYRGHVIDTDAQGALTRQQTVPISGSANSMAVDADGRVYIAGTPGGEIGDYSPYVAVYGATLENSQYILQQGFSTSISAVTVGDPCDIYLLGTASPSGGVILYDPEATYDYDSDFMVIHLVPEPSSALLVTGFATLTLAARRRR